MDRSQDVAQRDAELITCIRRDDAAALGILMRCYAEELTGLAMLTVHRMDLAQDAVQNVFVMTWERRRELNITGSVAAYLYRAVRNQAISILRHERAEHRAYDTLEQAYIVGDVVSWNDGEIHVQADEFDAAVRSALDGLQPQVREVFLMHRLQGMSYAEIAATLEVSVVTVRSQMSRAIKRIAEALGRG
jgi:RNA polymerase sigma-70 factor (ECF subfamily)